MLLFYTWPLKYLALGELSIFLIWGPILVAGVYSVLARGWTPTTWYVALAGVPFGLSVLSINLGKHIDKSAEDKKKGVGTLPVRIGEKVVPLLNMAVLVLIYAVILYLIFVTALFHAGHADRFPGREAPFLRRWRTGQAAPGRTAQGMARLADLVRWFLLSSQPPV